MAASEQAKYPLGRRILARPTEWTEETDAGWSGCSRPDLLVVVVVVMTMTMLKLLVLSLSKNGGGGGGGGGYRYCGRPGSGRDCCDEWPSLSVQVEMTSNGRTHKT